MNRKNDIQNLFASRIVLIVLIQWLSYFCASSQTIIHPKLPETTHKGFVYESEKSLEIRLQTNGPILISYNVGRLITYYKTNYYHFSLGFLKDKREKLLNKKIRFGSKSSRSFALGKQNSAIMLRAGIGRKKYLSENAKRKGIAIGYNVEGGASLALLIPYYLVLIDRPNDNNSASLYETKYTEENANDFLDTNGNTVFGRSNFFIGIDELTPIPGLHGNISILFALGYGTNRVRSFEVGFAVDLFIKKLNIMVENASLRNSAYFLNFYINFSIGRRK